MTNLDAVNKLIEWVIELDGKATTGWRVVDLINCYWDEIPEIHKDLILGYRTAAPKLARALRCAVEALETYFKDFGSALAEEALAEIDRIVKGEE